MASARKIFINYRRDDSRADAGRLYDRLHGRYPDRVFRDVGSLEPGVEWHEAIERVLSSSDACIVVIGPHWLTVSDANGKRRLDDPRDTVRKEVATALKAGMRVFPVLVGGAGMPDETDLPEDVRALARRNALELTEQDFDEDVDKLAKALERTLGWTPIKPKGPALSRSIIVGIAAAAVILVVTAALILMLRSSPASQVPPAASPASTGASPSSGANAAAVDGSKEHDPARPVSPGRTPIQVVGAWQAVVTADGRNISERVELYPDSSLRVMLENNTPAAVGVWRRDQSGEGIEIPAAINFVNNNIRFSCRLGSSPAGFQGTCADALQSVWRVSLSNARRLPDVDTNLPGVDLSGATMAEKAAFVQMLASEPCTCGCRLNMHTCLVKDRTCPLSPRLARTQWTAFIQLVRG
jgi:TIR domain